MYVCMYVCMFASVQSNILIAAAIRSVHTSRKKVKEISIVYSCALMDYENHLSISGWGAPHKCALNEVTCHNPGFGRDGKITWDW